LKTEATDRSERLLALLLVQNMKGATQAQKSLQLSVAGFTNVEIADILGTTAAVVSQYLYMTRKKKRAQ